MKGLYEQASFPADCFSCGECLNACAFDALAYASQPAKSPADGTGGAATADVMP
jgi:Fe-S-cluster-containing hydrogenase component 2